MEYKGFQLIGDHPFWPCHLRVVSKHLSATDMAEASKDRCHGGLRNLGTTCYLASVIQCLRQGHDVQVFDFLHFFFVIFHMFPLSCIEPMTESCLLHMEDYITFSKPVNCGTLSHDTADLCRTWRSPVPNFWLPMFSWWTAQAIRFLLDIHVFIVSLQELDGFRNYLWAVKWDALDLAAHNFHWLSPLPLCGKHVVHSAEEVERCICVQTGRFFFAGKTMGERSLRRSWPFWFPCSFSEAGARVAQRSVTWGHFVTAHGNRSG